MDTTQLIIVLAVVTLVAGIVIGLWQVARTRRAKRNHEHSSLASTPGLHDRNDPPRQREPQRPSIYGR